MNKSQLTVGELAVLLDAPEWRVRRIVDSPGVSIPRVRRIVDSPGVSIPRVGRYRLIPESLIPWIRAALELKTSRPADDAAA